MKRFLLILLIGSFLFSLGCKKYEEGPWLTFRKKEERVRNSWDFDRVWYNGLDVTSGTEAGSIQYNNSRIGFNDDNRFSVYYAYVLAPGDSSAQFVQYDGAWSFQNNHEELFLDFDGGQLPDQTWKITQLREKVLWCDEELGQDKFEYRLIPTN